MNLKRTVNSIVKIWLDFSGITYMNRLVEESDEEIKARKVKEKQKSMN